MRKAFENSQRRSQLPSNWKQVREEVLERDGHRCVETFSDGKRCPTTEGLEVDHIRRGNDHRLSNLRTLCEWHHLQKSTREGAEAINRRKQQINQKFRRTEAHPYA